MAKRSVAQVNDATEPSVDDIDETLLTTAPEDWEFETVSEESPIGVVLENPGDTFIGQFDGDMTISPENGKDDAFEVFLFIGRDERRYSMSKSYKLNAGMAAVSKGQWVRITLVKEIETGRGLNSMKDFRIEVKR